MRLAIVAALLSLGLTLGVHSQPTRSEQGGASQEREHTQEPQEQAHNPTPTEQGKPGSENAQSDHGDRTEHDPSNGDNETGLSSWARQWWGLFVEFVHANENFLVALGTLVTAAFTAILGAATMGLWIATRRLVKGADRTAERQLRAYVGMLDITVSKVRVG